MKDYFIDQILEKIILQNLEIHGFHFVTREAADILLDIIKSFITNLALHVSETTEYIRKSTINANDILYSLENLYSIHWMGLVEFIIYLKMNEKELPKLDFTFFKENVTKHGHHLLHGDLVSPHHFDDTKMEFALDEEENRDEIDLDKGSKGKIGYDYTDIEFTNKRRSKLIPILQQQQSETLPFYLPSFPRSITMEKENENEKNASQVEKKLDTDVDDLNILEIQQKVIESYRRRGKKRKRKQTVGKGEKINPYLRYALES